MRKTKRSKFFAVILVAALTLSQAPIPAQSASENYAAFVQDAFRIESMSPGTSVAGNLMHVYSDSGTYVNYVGKANIDYTIYKDYRSAVKFTLPATTARLVSATLKLKVNKKYGSPTATVTMTDDNSWQQTETTNTSTFPNYTAPVELVSNQSITAGNNSWQDISLTNLNALDTKIGATANDVTLIISGGNTSGYYFDFVADDDPSSDPGAELILQFAPIISSVVAPPNGTYITGDSLIYKVNFSETVTVTGTPYLTLTVGSTVVHANYQSGSGTNQLTFGYTLAPGDKDTDGVTLASNVSLGGGSIQDEGNNAALTFTGSTASSVLVKSAQTITFDNPGAQSFGTGPTLTATSDSGLHVTLTSDTPEVCSVSSEGVLTFLKAGLATISAHQAGNSEYLPAATVSRSFDVNATVPDAPTAVAAMKGNAQASVSFTAPTFSGGAAIEEYTVTSSPGGITATGTASPITVTGLTNGTAYTFTVTATNSAGIGLPSSASNSVTPAKPTYTIVASSGSGVSINPSGSVSVTTGDSQTFTMTSDANCRIASVLVDGVNEGAISVYTFSNVTENHTIAVSAIVVLDTPIGLVWDSALPGKAKWNAVTNASGYSVRLYKDGHAKGSTINVAADTSYYDFSSAIASLGAGTYTFAVMAKGDGQNYANSSASDVSGEYSFVPPMPTPTRTPAPTAMPAPTAKPTTTPIPTRTPTPTATPTTKPLPTAALAPTATPTPTPTATSVPTIVTPVASVSPSPSRAASPNTRAITGMLVDSNGQRMAGYVVTLQPQQLTSVTDANGRFAFSEVDYTNHELIVKTTEGEEITTYKLLFTQGDEFNADVTENGVSITYTGSTATVDIEVAVAEDNSGAAIIQVSAASYSHADEQAGGNGSILLWIGTGALAVILIALLMIIRLMRKKKV